MLACAAFVIFFLWMTKKAGIWLYRKFLRKEEPVELDWFEKWHENEPM
jgi:hypothetical protein